MSSLAEEVEIINSIYENAASLSQEAYTVSLQVPETEKEVRIKLWFPLQYPEEAPRVIGVTGIPSDTINTMQYIVDGTFVPGEVFMFTFLDEVKPLVNELLAAEAEQQRQQHDAGVAAETSKGSDRIGEWAVTTEIRDRGSVFIGRAIAASSLSEVEELLTDLQYDKKLAKATHNMAAWRIRLDDHGTQFAQDFDEDGESGAGACMLHILQMSNAQNVVVVVTRYFGGTHLGPDRFKHIKSSTRDALVAGSFLNSSK